MNRQYSRHQRSAMRCRHDARAYGAGGLSLQPVMRPVNRIDVSERKGQPR